MDKTELEENFCDHLCDIWIDVVVLIEVPFCGDHGRVFFLLQTTHLAPWLHRSVFKIPKMKY